MIRGADCRSVAGPTNYHGRAFIPARTVHRPTVTKTHEQFDCVHVSGTHGSDLHVTHVAPPKDVHAYHIMLRVRAP